MTAVAARGLAARLAALTGGALVLAGCSLVPVEENTFESAPLPAISAAGVEQVLADVDRALSAANAARDPELLAAIADAPLLDVDSARYALDSLADPDDSDAAPRVEHRDPTVFIPRFAGYPQWFVVAATTGPDDAVRLEVLAREGAGAVWRVLTAPELLPNVEFPVLALDDMGYVVPLERSALSTLPISPGELAAQHAEALGAASTGETNLTPTPTGTTTPTPTPTDTTSPSAAPPPATTSPASPSASTTPTSTPSAVNADDLATRIAADPWTIARVQADAAAATAVGPAATVTSTYATGTVLGQALRTEDGGALVFYALTGERAYAVTATYFLQLDALTAAIVGKPEVTSELTEGWAAQVAVYIPPDETGVPRVVAARWDRVGLTGS